MASDSPLQTTAPKTGVRGACAFRRTEGFVLRSKTLGPVANSDGSTWH